MTERMLASLLQPFAPFLADPETIEIVVNRPHEIGVEARGQWTWHPADLSYDHLEAIGILSAFQTSQELSPAHPIVTAKIPTGQRIHINRPPATAPGIVSIDIRQPTAQAPTVAALAKTGMFTTRQNTPPAADLVSSLGVDLGFNLADDLGHQLAYRLVEAVHQRRNILIAGATNTGKTTLAQALIAIIPLLERIITVEDTPEWNRLPHHNRVALYYSKGEQGTAAIRPEELLEASLRMRPDRVLMGELRDGAAWTYLRSIVAGHPGCITTLHANSAEGAFNALRLMMRQNQEGRTMPDDVITGLLRDLVDIVVHLERDKDQIHVTSVYERRAAGADRPDNTGLL